MSGSPASPTPPVRRLGIYGGAFDPPHNAHVALARAAIAQLGLEKLLIIPTGQAWHRSGTLSDAAHRLAMAKLAFADVAGTVVDDREIRRDGPTYTIDTLLELRREEPDAQWYLLMGADQADALPNWHRWQEVAQNAIISIAGRAQSTGTRARFLQDLEASGRIRAIDMPPMDVSATEIRRRAGLGQGIAPLVPPAIAGYIANYHLYQNA